MPRLSGTVTSVPKAIVRICGSLFVANNLVNEYSTFYGNVLLFYFKYMFELLKEDNTMN